MLLVPYIRENRDLVIERYQKRQLDATETIDQVLELDDRRKATQQELDNHLSEANKLAKEIGQLFKSGKIEEGNKAKTATADLKVKIQELNLFHMIGK